MAFDRAIANFARGSDLTMTLTEIEVDAGDSIASATFMIKRDARRDTDAEALITKGPVTGTNQPGIGQVIDTGATDQEGAVRIDLVGATDTVLLVAGVAYDFGLKVTTALGKKIECCTGTIMTRQRVVRA